MRAFLVYAVKSLVFRTSSIGVIALGALLSCGVARGQDAAGIAATGPRPLITQAVDESLVSVLKGNTHPLARAEFDLGTAPAALPMQRMLLVLKRSDAQEAALEQLLDDLQNKNSPNYHNWLTPEQFGQQFGPTDADMQTITNWLQSHGFEVGSTKGRTVLEFSGSASQVQEAFHTTIHKYVVNGEQHWANASDPSIPMALTPAVAGIESLNNFPRRAMNVPAGVFKRDKNTGMMQTVKSLFTFNPGFQCSADVYCFAVAPYDFATIYNVLPLWNAGINGAGQTVAIVGESNINLNDVTSFRSMFGLPANNPTIVLNGPDPGIQGDEGEADIDVQWAGAVAPNATIDLVLSASTETTAGVELSAVYIVENNLAGVMSESYGECELGLGTTGNQFFNTLWQQAAAQGITVLIAAGDNGAAGCDNFNASPPAPAQFGLQVSGYASTPYNVAVGGTDFNDLRNPTTYWSTTNNSTTQASALSYIPETTWNDSCTNALWGTVQGLSTNPETNCNNPRLNDVVTVGGSGGMSHCTTPSGATAASCAGGYAKPTWQSGTGVPADGKRDIPDVSLFASNGFVGNFYVICESDVTYGTCSPNYPYFLGLGGTSVSSPAFAGIMALVMQEQGGQRQGNANYILYKLAAQQPTAFHDVPSGSTIAMPCLTGSPNCTTKTAGDSYGVLSGYSTTTGYDQATGLGSVDANNLVTKWSLVTLAPSVTTLSSLTPTTLTHGQAVNFTASVKPQTGAGTPSGQISLMGGTSGTQSVAAFALSSGAASGSTEMLPGGSYSVTAHYPGDATYGASDSAPISVTVNAESSQTQLLLETFDWNGNLISGNATTAPYGSPYLLRVNVENGAGQMCSPVAKSGTTPTACPTGNVTLTNNGSALDAGTYTLNSYGYLEDLTVQLPGGRNSVQSSYTGDTSFAASSSTTPITITPAPTSSSTPYIQSGGVGLGFVGTVTIQAQSSGVAPTGTVSFDVNGSPVTGTTTYQGTAGSAFAPTASLNATFTSQTNVFPKAGSYTISVSYSGDADYASSTSPAYTVNEKYQSPFLSIGPPSVTVAAGQSVTVLAIIDTNMPNVPLPTGTVPFINWGPMTSINGTETYSQVTDSNGNVVLQASMTFVPAANVEVGASYGGDANYPSAAGGGLSEVTVTGSDFALIPMQNSITLSPGQQSGFSIFVQGQSNYNGTINFSSASCSGLPAESSCVFGPASMTGAGYTNLSVTTMAPHSAAQRRLSLGWIVTVSLPLGGILLIPSRLRRKRLIALITLSVLVIFIVGCGGGSGSSSGGGFTDPGTPRGNYTVTVTATSGSLSHSFNFTLMVQ